MSWSDNKRMYFFRTDDEYVRFNMVTHETVTFLDYPLPINNHNWSGMGSYGKLIRAAYKQGDHEYIFLKDGTYLKYSIPSDEVVNGYPKDVNNHNWPGLGGYGKSIVATLGYKDDVYFFLADGRFIKYSRQADKALTGYPKEVNNTTWPGLGSYGKSITAAFSDPAHPDYAYFFLDNNTYIKYDKQADKALSGYPKPMNNTTWPGLLGY